ncbi:unnamed protein product [Prunus armeniaca]
MPHVFRGLLNRVVRGMRLRLTNGPLRAARIAALIEVVSPRPARICGSNISGISQACKDCGSSRLGVSEACEDGIDGINGIDGSKMRLEGQFGHLCPTFARCRTHTGFDSNSKVEFESGPVRSTCLKFEREFERICFCPGPHVARTLQTTGVSECRSVGHADKAPTCPRHALDTING